MFGVWLGKEISPVEPSWLQSFNPHFVILFTDILALRVETGNVYYAALKLFQKKRNKVMLRFCSKNPKYKAYTFTGYNHEEFQIVGIAIAVFKPLHVTS